MLRVFELYRLRTARESLVSVRRGPAARCQPATEQDQHEPDSGAETEVLVENPDAEEHGNGWIHVRHDGRPGCTRVRNHVHEQHQPERRADDARARRPSVSADIGRQHARQP